MKASILAILFALATLFGVAASSSSADAHATYAGTWDQRGWTQLDYTRYHSCVYWPDTGTFAWHGYARWNISWYVLERGGWVFHHVHYGYWWGPSRTYIPCSP
jgi:hypothetical protein